MTDLYSVLGVAPDASTQKIRAAYRKLAKTAHPDAGGDPAVFARIKRAHDILIDPERRAKYDATGDVSESQPDNTMGQVLQILAGVLHAVILEAVDKGRSPTKFNVAFEMSHHLKKGLEGIEADVVKIERLIAEYLSILGRFSADEGENHLESITRAQIEAIMRNLQAAKDHQARVERAIEIVEASDFRFDQIIEYPVPRTRYNHTSASSMFTIKFP